MRGRERFIVAALLGLSAAASGALVGFAAGVAWSVTGLGPLAGIAILAIVALSIVLDSRVPPLSVRRQVPQAWGRIFGTRTVAILYGGRLGVGPLTILRTWMWWASFIVGASAGPSWGAAVGALFGAARVAAMLGAGTRAGTLRSLERVGAPALAVLVLAATAAVIGVGNAPSEPAPLSVPSLTDMGVDAVDRDVSSAPTSEPSRVEDVGLESSLPAEILAGWDRVPDDPARHLGPLDLAAAAAAEEDTAAERSLLETRHFERGQARAWRPDANQPDANLIAYSSLYEFASPADATAYLADGMTTIEARGARVYDVAEVASARGFSQAERTDDGSTVSHGVAFVRGARFYLVFVSGRNSSATADVATSAAAGVDRHARLAPE